MLGQWTRERIEERSFRMKKLFLTLVMVLLRGCSGDSARKPEWAARKMRFAHERDENFHEG